MLPSWCSCGLLLQAAKEAAADGEGGGHHVGEDAERHALPSSNGGAASGEHPGPETFWDRKSWPNDP